jgi:hypothetical protein
MGPPGRLCVRPLHSRAHRARGLSARGGVGPEVRQFKDAVREIDRTCRRSSIRIDVPGVSWQPIAGGFYVIDLGTAPQGGRQDHGQIINPTSVTHENPALVARRREEATFSLPTYRRASPRPSTSAARRPLRRQACLPVPGQLDDLILELDDPRGAGAGPSTRTSSSVAARAVGGGRPDRPDPTASTCGWRRPRRVPGTSKSALHVTRFGERAPVAVAGGERLAGAPIAAATALMQRAAGVGPQHFTTPLA